MATSKENGAIPRPATTPDLRRDALNGSERKGPGMEPRRGRDQHQREIARKGINSRSSRQGRRDRPRCAQRKHDSHETTTRSTPAPCPSSQKPPHPGAGCPDGSTSPRAYRGENGVHTCKCGFAKVVSLPRLRQLGTLGDDNALIFRGRTPKGRHYTARPGAPPTWRQDRSFGGGCFGNFRWS